MMIKHKVVGTVLALILASGFLVPIPAQEASVLTPAGQSTMEGRTFLAFTGPEGMRILALTPFPDDARQRLERVVSVISSWPTIQITELRAESSKGVDDYVLAFPSIQSEGREYSANVPGGLRLRFDGALMYDFRVRSGDYFVRVRGVLMDEASLIEEIVMAVRDPGAYIAERDPSWLALRIEQLDKFNTQQDRRMDQLDGRLDQLDSRTVEINRRLTQKTDKTASLLDTSVLELEALVETRTREGKTHMDARFAEIKSMADEMADAMADDFADRLEQMRKESAEERNRLETDFNDSLRNNQAQFNSTSEALRLALASEMNRGFFGGPRPLDPAVFDHVMALKASNPSIDRDVAQESAKAAELKPRGKEIDIIFRIWFGE